MSRRVTVTIALVLVGATGVLSWWILRDPTTTPPPRQPVGGLSDTVTVSWTDGHTAHIDARTRLDGVAALGYVHGITRPWTVTVWRRTALGTLSASFGNRLVSLDRHTRRLGFGHHARQTYARLPDATQRRLQAYVRGLNTALQSSRVKRRAPFVSLSLAPQRWQPWHPLAIARLLAWTGTDLASVPDSVESSRFWSTDRTLRRWLHLHGQRRSIAWAARSTTDSSKTALFTRHVLGATAEPTLQEVALRYGDGDQTVVATLPGTLLAPTGTTGMQAWTTLLISGTKLKHTAIDASQRDTRYERLRTASGNEHLVEVHQHDDGLILPSSPGDSAWVLQWPGLHATSALPSWSMGTSLPPDSISSLHLFENAGLTVDARGTWRVWGTPSVVHRGPNTILVGQSDWSRHQADALQTLQTKEAVDPARWSRSDSSTWAASLLPRLLDDLEPLSGMDPTVTTALSYLRNWTCVYEPASIGAVVFEEWMRQHRTEAGQLPSPTDSALFAAPRHRRTFRQAVRRLAEQYGSDVRQWRWGRVAPDRRYYPVWSADSLLATDASKLSGTRFAPLDRPGRGHASTLGGGPALMDPLPLGPAPTHWDGWMKSGTPRLTVRRVRFDPSGFLARSLRSREPPPPVSVTGAPVSRTTTLVPARE